ncbi:hypothetical protein [Streptomyces sp. GMY02]|uniref:hypothetical protein n=1 Tax=Streptomyces sp. GMY02 TaxID=1333528 RepID=UPI0020B90069|nr:hypothetical protein [Streptomyces sp. GMY02]
MNGSTVRDITENTAGNNTAGPGASTAEQRFALLTARAGLEPELAQRYSKHPLSVLAEFGLPATWPVHFPGGRTDERPDHRTEGRAGRPDAIAREDLDRAGSSVTWGCFSNFTHHSAPAR